MAELWGGVHGGRHDNVHHAGGAQEEGGTLLEEPVPREVKWSKQGFIKHLVEKMREVGARDSSVEKAKLFIEYFVDDSFFDELNRRSLEPGDVVRRAASDGLAVIDLSADTDLTVKQAIIADIIEAAWDMVKRGTIEIPANLVFVIDEAQNYVPEDEWTICKDPPIETTVREGRKWGLSLLLASQRIARDIKSSVRANLGTVFFSRLSAQADLKEIGAYLDIADISEGTLSQLGGTREFFVAGLMNPLRKPPPAQGQGGGVKVEEDYSIDFWIDPPLLLSIVADVKEIVKKLNKAESSKIVEEVKAALGAGPGG